MVNKQNVLIGLFLLICHHAFAQWSYDVSFGLNASADQFQKPEGFEFTSPFIDPRWRILSTVGANYSFDNRLSLYGETGVLQYETYLQIGPFLDPTGVGVQLPFYELFHSWLGPYTEAGIEYPLLNHSKYQLSMGMGLGYSFDLDNKSREIPTTGTGWATIPQVLEYSVTLTYLRIQNFFLSPSISISRSTKRGNSVWLKAKYNQGLLLQHEGEFNYVRSLDFDNEIVPGSEFSFPVRLRNSFYSISVGFTLVPQKGR